MKNKSFTFTLVIAVLVITSTSYAWGVYGYSQDDPDKVYAYGPNCPYPGSRCNAPLRYGYMMGRGCYYGMRQGYRGRGMFSWLTTEQQNKLNTLRQKFIDETNSDRIRLREEQEKLEKEMTSSLPDRNKIKLLIKKISGLREILMEKSIDFRLDAKKIAPFLGDRNNNPIYDGRRSNRMMGNMF